MRQFPGAPEPFVGPFSDTLLEAIRSSSKGDLNPRFLVAFDALNLCLFTPRSYFDLYQDVMSIYPRISNVWNDEVFVRNGGELGSGKMMTLDVDASIEGVDMSIVKQLDAGFVAVLMGMVSFSQDPKILRKMDETTSEQLSCYNRIVWLLYMSLFRKTWFDEVIGVFERGARRAREERARMVMNGRAN